MPSLTRRGMFRASTVNGGGFLVATMVALVWSYLVVRSFPGTESGNLLLAISLAGLINLLDLGVSLGLTRMISATPGKDPTDAPRNCFIAALWVTSGVELLVGVGVAAGWVSITTVVPRMIVLAIAAFAVSTQVVLLCTSALKGLLDFKAASLVSTGSTLLVYGGGVGVILSPGADVWFVLLTMTGLQLTCAAAAIALTLRRLPPAAETRLLSTYRKLLTASITLFPQMFTGLFFAHAQRFIIARYAGLEAVAAISFAYSVSTRLHSVMNSFLEVIFPMTRQLQAQGVKLGGFCLRVGALSALAYLLIAGLVIAAAAFLMPDVVSPLTAYSVGVLFAIASAPAYHLLNGSGASAQVSFCALIGPVMFVLIAQALRHAAQVSGQILMPLSYAVTLALTAVFVVILVRRHADHFSAHRPVA